MQLVRRLGFWNPPEKPVLPAEQPAAPSAAPSAEPSEAWMPLDAPAAREMPPELQSLLVPDSPLHAPPNTPSESSFEVDFGDCAASVAPTEACELQELPARHPPWREAAAWRRRAEAELAGAASLEDLAGALWRLRDASPELSWKKFYARCGRLGVCLTTFERHVGLAAQLRARPELRVPAADLRTEDQRIVRRAFAVRLAGH